MKLILELTPDQLDELAQRVAEKMTKPRPKETYTIKETANLLGVCKQTIRRRIATKTIPIIPGLGAKRISAATLEKLLTQK